MVIQHNMASVASKIHLKRNTGSMAKVLEKLSTGYSINRAADNAAGLAVSERMRRSIACLSEASKNAQDGISLLQTAEGALSETHTLLEVMSKMSVLAANATYSERIDRAAMQLEFEQLMEEIDSISTDTDFNDIFLLDGSLQENDDGEGGIEFHLSEYSTEGDYSVSIDKTDCEALGIKDISIDTQENANKAIDVLGEAIDKVSRVRGRCGAMQTRMEHCLNNLNNKHENLSAADSRLRDTDMANELMKYTKFEILSSSSESMMAQANAQPAGVINLLSSASTNKIEKPAQKDTTEKASAESNEK